MHEARRVPYIAVFSLAYAPFEGGAEIAVREIMKRIAARRFAVFTHRFDAAWPAEETQGNAAIIRVGRGKAAGGNVRAYYGGTFEKLRYIFRAWRAAEKRHREESFTALWAVMASYAGIAAVLFKLRHPRIPLLLTLQEGDAEADIVRTVGPLYPLWRFIFKRADAIQTISGYLKEFAKRHGARCATVVIPNGVDAAWFRARNAPDALHENSIVTTSRLVKKNGVDVLLRALPLIRKKVPDVHCSILGDGPERESLEALAQSLDLKETVRFLGSIPYAEVPQHVAHARIFVRASRSEGLGSSFLEAMAAGVPVIGTLVGGIPDFLKDGETGLACAVDNPDDLAEKAIRLLKDAKLQGRLAANARALMRKHYRWEILAERMEVLFRTLEGAWRVIVATGAYPPDIGGAASYSRLLAEELPAYGITAEVLTYAENKMHGIHSVSRRWPKGLRHLLYGMRLLWCSRRFHIILAADSSFGAAFPAFLVAKFLRKRFFVRVTGDYAWEQGVQRFKVQENIDEFQNKRYGFAVELLRACERRVVCGADLVIAPSAYLKKIAEGWGAPRARVKVIYNAFHQERIVSSKREARAALGLKGTILVSIGRLVPWKGFLALIDVVAELVRDVPDIVLFIIGGGPDERRLREAIVKNGMESHVRMIGSLSKEEVFRYLAAAHVFVLNTAYEGFSHQILEAMSVGVPVVTTAVGGNPELVTQREDGILVSPGDVKGIADAIRELLASRELRERFIAHAKKTSGQFSSERMLKELTSTFHTL